jgi:hypothetical protein
MSSSASPYVGGHPLSVNGLLSVADTAVVPPRLVRALAEVPPLPPVPPDAVTTIPPVPLMALAPPSAGRVESFPLSTLSFPPQAASVNTTTIVSAGMTGHFERIEEPFPVSRP